jgi:putative membrane protein
MRKSIWTMLLALPLMAMAADKSPDESFYKDAAEGGLAEVQLGQMAQDKGQSTAVKDFGRMMVQDHTAANEKLKSVAVGRGVELPASPGVSQMATKTKLQVLTGDSFDKSYIKSMVEDHKDTIKLFQKEAQSGQDPNARAFAQATLPTLQTHLKKIQSIAKTAGISAD